MRTLHTIAIALVIPVLLLASQSFAKESSQNQPRAIAFPSCKGGLKKFGDELLSMERALEAWAKSPEASTLADATGPDTRERRLTYLFATHSLPDKVRFRAMHVQCWIHFVDLERASQKNDLAQAKDAIESWQGCIEALYSENPPPEIKELLSCWKAVSASAGAKSSKKK